MRRDRPGAKQHRHCQADRKANSPLQFYQREAWRAPLEAVRIARQLCLAGNSRAMESTRIYLKPFTAEVYKPRELPGKDWEAWRREQSGRAILLFVDACPKFRHFAVAIAVKEHAFAVARTVQGKHQRAGVVAGVRPTR
jgi:hypothetical protein